MRPFEAETIRDLAGALGDMVYALFVWPNADEPLVDVLIDGEDHEFLCQRLLLAGYRSDDIEGPVIIWWTPDEVLVRSLESGEPWSLEALRSATRSRDSIGAPRIPVTRFVVGLVAQFSEPERYARTLIERMTSVEVAELRNLITSLAPAGLPELDQLIGGLKDG